MQTTSQLARDAYRRLFDRERHAEQMAERSFLRAFVRPGELVFDVGAYRGYVAEALLAIGGRVVAIEPNPDLAGLLRRRFGHRIDVVEAAAGAAEGEAMLHLGRKEPHSTLSTEWRERAPASHVWEGEVSVRVTTLDRLIGSYGRPALVKIDVEGYEHAVLEGLSTPLPTISFEFHCRALDLARLCIERLDGLGAYSYAHTVSKARRLDSPFLPGPELWRRLESLRAAEGDQYGDVIAVLPAESS